MANRLKLGQGQMLSAIDWKKKTTSSLVTKQNCTDLHFHDIDLELKNNKAGRPAKRQ